MMNIGIGMNMGMMPFGPNLLQKAMMMVQGGGVGMSMGVQMPGMSMGMSIGMGDRVGFSPDAMMGGRSSFFHPLMGGMMPQIGCGAGMGMVPGMRPGCGRMQGNQMKMMMMMMMMLMKMMQQQGGRHPMMGRGMGMPSPQQQMMHGMGQMMKGMGNMMQGMSRMPGLGMCPGMRGMRRPMPMQRGRRGRGGGGCVELRKGQSFTTPGGCQISWKGHTVSVKEPGGQVRMLGGGAMGAGMAAGGSAMAFAGAFAGPGYAGAFAGAMVSTGGAAGVGAAGMGAIGGSTKPNNWKVWGDPHIKDGRGKQQDFKTNNAMFSLKDGSRVAMCAAGPKGVVQRVRIFLPGTQVNKNTLGGINPHKTTVYHNKGLAKVAGGTLDKYMGFPGMNVSPFGMPMF